VVVRRGEVYLVALDPTVGYEIRKTRPCLVVSSDEVNAIMGTVIVAPMTSKGRPFPMRVACEFAGKAGLVVLDQLRSVDKTRLRKRLGAIDEAVQKAVLDTLAKMFAE
jgi:mRNA interferase MazF